MFRVPSWLYVALSFYFSYRSTFPHHSRMPSGRLRLLAAMSFTLPLAFALICTSDCE